MIKERLRSNKKWSGAGGKGEKLRL